MIIHQAYTSIPISKFKFRSLFGMDECGDINSPLLVFGMYRKEDVRMVLRHSRGRKTVIVWLGNDSTKVDLSKVRSENIIHTTWLPRVKEYLKLNGDIDCILLKFPAHEKPNPMVLGPRVYAYLQKGKPKYHGSDTVLDLDMSYPLLVGDHSVPRQEWWNGIGDKWYRKSFIGLFLSEYTGGGCGIVEMGLRGRKVITNVLNLPHCIPWKTKEDVEAIIEREAEHIGIQDTYLAEEVYASLAKGKDLEHFDLERMAA